MQFSRFAPLTWILALTLTTTMAASAQERKPDHINYSNDQSEGLAGLEQFGASEAEVEDALDLAPAEVISITFGGTDSAGFEVFTTGATSFPTQGSDYFVLSSGATASALTANDSESTSTVLSGSNTSQGEDLSQTILILQPPAGASCLAFDFAFYSEEFPEFVDSEFNDAFIAEIGQSTFQISGSQVIAPNNFAFDSELNVVSVNTVFGVTAGNSAGTTYDGGTPLLTAKTPLDDSSQITVTLSIMDLGDSIYDSTVFVDRFRWLFGVSCEAGADADSDRDSLLDSWETDGIDFDNDGIVDLDLPAMGANPMHKDIFIECDYMVKPGMSGHTHKPTRNALQIVIDSFANAPLSNPDEVDGITMHIDAGADTIMNPITGDEWEDMSESTVLDHDDNLGTCSGSTYNWTEFDGIKGAGSPGSFPVERGDVFHYCIFAHALCTAKPTTSGTSRGTPGSDFIVSFGGWGSNPGTDNQQGGTIQHELGHNLGLRHGGGDNVNRKPNYLSVMNYLFQMGGVRFDGMDGLFDYSPFTLPALNEGSLNEPIGLSGVAGTAKYGTRHCDSSGVQVNNDDINSGIDWNGDGDAVDNPTSVNINCGSGTALASFDDWAAIKFNGGSIGAFGEDIEQPEETDDPDDITELENEAIPLDLAVSVDGPGNVLLAAGGSATYKYTVMNDGDQADIYDITTSQSDSWANLVGVPSTLELSPGQSSTFSIVVHVPSGAMPGDSHLLTVVAISTINAAIVDSAETRTIVSPVAIDFRPDSEDNVHNGGRLMPVAVLGSSGFDVAEIDVSTIAFGPGEAGLFHPKGHYEDVNDDQITDLVAHFETVEAAIGASDSDVCLMAETRDGAVVGDCDTISRRTGCGRGFEIALVLPLLTLVCRRRVSLDA